MKKTALFETASISQLMYWIGLWGLMVACQPHNIAIVKQKHRVPSDITEVAQGRLAPDLIDPDYVVVGDMATLSSHVYMGAKPISQRPDYDTSGKDTLTPPKTPKKAQARKAELLMRKNERAKLEENGWHPFPFSYRLQPPIGQRMIGGLVYDVWIRNKPGLPIIAALVFRGTDDFLGPDWGGANVRPITNTKHKWDQYEQVRALTPVLVAKLDSAYGKNVLIFATGHSLGGGLAQHACYTSERIKKVFAFDTSPLTGYFDFPKGKRPTVANGRRIYRIYESNEVLSTPRFLTGFMRKGFDIVLVRYNFSSPSEGVRGIHQHSIARLAANLRGEK